MAFEKLESLKCEIDVTDRGLYKIKLPAQESSRKLFEIALASKVQIRHFQQSRTTLEDTFVTAIGVNHEH